MFHGGKVKNAQSWFRSMFSSPRLYVCQIKDVLTHSLDGWIKMTKLARISTMDITEWNTHWLLLVLFKNLENLINFFHFLFAWLGPWDFVWSDSGWSWELYWIGPVRQGRYLCLLRGAIHPLIKAFFCLIKAKFVKPDLLLGQKVYRTHGSTEEKTRENRREMNDQDIWEKRKTKVTYYFE